MTNAVRAASSATTIFEPAAAAARATVEKFFANYGLIANWPAFTAEQSKLLAPGLATITTDHRGAKSYVAPAGYFASLGDWAAAFATGPDFRVEITEASATRVRARLHGTLTLKAPIKGKLTVSDSEHAWTETFAIDVQGKIAKLNVDMNLRI